MDENKVQDNQFVASFVEEPPVFVDYSPIYSDVPTPEERTAFFTMLGPEEVAQFTQDYTSQIDTYMEMNPATYNEGEKALYAKTKTVNKREKQLAYYGTSADEFWEQKFLPGDSYKKAPVRTKLNLDPEAGPVQNMFDLLQRPLHAITGAIDNVFDENTTTTFIEGASEGLMGVEEVTGTELLATMTNQTLEEMGAVGRITGFAIDIFADPMTYLNPIGAVAKTVGKGAKAVGAAVPAIDDAYTAISKGLTKRFDSTGTVANHLDSLARLSKHQVTGFEREAHEIFKRYINDSKKLEDEWRNTGSYQTAEEFYRKGFDDLEQPASKLMLTDLMQGSPTIDINTSDLNHTFNVQSGSSIDLYTTSDFTSIEQQIYDSLTPAAKSRHDRGNTQFRLVRHGKANTEMNEKDFKVEMEKALGRDATPAQYRRYRQEHAFTDKLANDGETKVFTLQLLARQGDEMFTPDKHIIMDQVSGIPPELAAKLDPEHVMAMETLVKGFKADLKKLNGEFQRLTDLPYKFEDLFIGGMSDDYLPLVVYDALDPTGKKAAKQLEKGLLVKGNAKAIGPKTQYGKLSSTVDKEISAFARVSEAPEQLEQELKRLKTSINTHGTQKRHVLTSFLTKDEYINNPNLALKMEDDLKIIETLTQQTDEASESIVGFRYSPSYNDLVGAVLRGYDETLVKMIQNYVIDPNPDDYDAIRKYSDSLDPFHVDETEVKRMSQDLVEIQRLRNAVESKDFSKTMVSNNSEARAEVNEIIKRYTKGGESQYNSAQATKLINEALEERPVLSEDGFRAEVGVDDLSRDTLYKIAGYDTAEAKAQAAEYMQKPLDLLEAIKDGESDILGGAQLKFNTMNVLNDFINDEFFNRKYFKRSQLKDEKFYKNILSKFGLNSRDYTLSKKKDGTYRVRIADQGVAKMNKKFRENPVSKIFDGTETTQKLLNEVLTNNNTMHAYISTMSKLQEQLVSEINYFGREVEYNLKSGRFEPDSPEYHNYVNTATKQLRTKVQRLDQQTKNIDTFFKELSLNVGKDLDSTLDKDDIRSKKNRTQYKTMNHHISDILHKNRVVRDTMNNSSGLVGKANVTPEDKFANTFDIAMKNIDKSSLDVNRSILRDINNLTKVSASVGEELMSIQTKLHPLTINEAVGKDSKDFMFSKYGDEGVSQNLKNALRSTNDLAIKNLMISADDTDLGALSAASGDYETFMNSVGAMRRSYKVKNDFLSEMRDIMYTTDKDGNFLEGTPIIDLMDQKKAVEQSLFRIDDVVENYRDKKIIADPFVAMAHKYNGISKQVSATEFARDLVEMIGPNAGQFKLIEAGTAMNGQEINLEHLFASIGAGYSEASRDVLKALEKDAKALTGAFNLRNLAIEVDADTKRLFDRSLNEEVLPKFIELFDTATAYIKGGQLLSASFHIGNVFGNSMLSWVGGSNPMKQMHYAQRAKREMDQYSKIMKDLMEDPHYVPNTEDLQIVNRVNKWHASGMDVVKGAGSNGKLFEEYIGEGKDPNMLQKLYNANFDFSSRYENAQRYGFYLFALNEPQNIPQWVREKNNTRSKRLLSPDKFSDAEVDALHAVEQMLFNFQDTTHFERQYMQRVIPFYNFIKKSSIQSANLLLHDYKKVSNTYKFYQSMSERYMTLTGTTEEEMPDYYLTSGIIPSVILSNNEVTSGIKMPTPYLQGLDSFMTPVDTMISSTNALIKAPIEWIMNESMYDGSEIYNVNNDHAYYEMLKNTMSQFGFQWINNGLETANAFLKTFVTSDPQMMYTEPSTKNFIPSVVKSSDNIQTRTFKQKDMVDKYDAIFEKENFNKQLDINALAKAETFAKLDPNNQKQVMMFMTLLDK